MEAVPSALDALGAESCAWVDDGAYCLTWVWNGMVWYGEGWKGGRQRACEGSIKASWFVGHVRAPVQ